MEQVRYKLNLQFFAEGDPEPEPEPEPEPNPTPKTKEDMPEWVNKLNENIQKLTAQLSSQPTEPPKGPVKVPTPEPPTPEPEPEPIDEPEPEPKPSKTKSLLDWLM